MGLPALIFDRPRRACEDTRLMSYERDNIRRLVAYTPGEQPQRGTVVKLNTNENPYPPSPAVMRAIAGVTGDMLRRYPPPSAQRFREVAAAVHCVSPEHIIATNGGDELLRMAIGVFCRPRGEASDPSSSDAITDGNEAGGLAMAEPSYSLYPVLADIHHTPLLRVPLDDDFALTASFADRVVKAGCKLAILVNPHAPSGRLESIATLRRIARDLGQAGCVLLVDEAYVNFATHDALPLVKDDAGLDNVMLLRTMSKGFSLAGLRFGYGIGHPRLIAAMHKARDSYNVDVLAQAAATAALEHRDDAGATWTKVIAQRARLTQELRQRGFIVPESQANFILVTPPGEVNIGAATRTTTTIAARPSARAIYESLKAQGIFVRYFDQDRLGDKLRITIGSAEQNDALLAALDKMGV